MSAVVLCEHETAMINVTVDGADLTMQHSNRTLSNQIHNSLGQCLSFQCEPAVCEQRKMGE